MNPIHVLKIPLFIAQLLPYLLVTLAYVALSLVFGGALGFVLACAKVGKNPFARLVARGYTTVLRCTPSLVLLFLVYFGLPALVDAVAGINIANANSLCFVVITFSLFLGASLSEVMRTAYGAVNRGQREAALSVGLTEAEAFVRIVLPQAFYVALPNLGNTVIYLVKEGSLAFTIGLVDVMGKASLINTRTMGGYVIEIYIALTAIYWPLSLAIERGFTSLEARYGYAHKKEAASHVV